MTALYQWNPALDAQTALRICLQLEIFNTPQIFCEEKEEEEEGEWGGGGGEGEGEEQQQ